jgi:hypothetical protein
MRNLEPPRPEPGRGRNLPRIRDLPTDGSGDHRLSAYSSSMVASLPPSRRGSAGHKLECAFGFARVRDRQIKVSRKLDSALNQWLISLAQHTFAHPVGTTLMTTLIHHLLIVDSTAASSPPI